MKRTMFLLAAAFFAAVTTGSAYAQQAKTYRIGVIREGGPDIAAVQGLTEGLKELGLVEGRDYVLVNRDLMGDRAAVPTTAESLEREQVDVIYSIATSVTILVQRSTMKVPVVFAVGSDPVAAGLVRSFGRPGGRLSGVHYSTTDTTAKRLQILKTILPDLRRVLTFYDPGSGVSKQALQSTRDAASQLEVEVVAQPVRSVRELREQIAAFTPQRADAFFYINDAMVRSQAQLIIDGMRDKGIPTMFSFPSIVAQGALVGYGVSLREVGRLSSRYVHKVLAGARPGDLPVESVSRIELSVNARTARQLGVTIPQSVLLGATEVVQ